MKYMLVDVDDTVLEAADALQQFLADECDLVSEQRLKDHHNIPNLYGITIEQTLDCIRRFHRAPVMGRLPPLPCAATVLPALYRAGYRFVAITACLDEEAVVAARRANLEAAFGFPWEAVHCLGLTLCKRAALAAYPPSVWVDDLATHAAAGADIGHRSFLLDTPYNRGADLVGVTRVSDWHQLAQHLPV